MMNSKPRQGRHKSGNTDRDGRETTHKYQEQEARTKTTPATNKFNQHKITSKVRGTQQTQQKGTTHK